MVEIHDMNDSQHEKFSSSLAPFCPIPFLPFSAMLVAEWNFMSNLFLSIPGSRRPWILFLVSAFALQSLSLARSFPKMARIDIIVYSIDGC